MTWVERNDPWYRIETRYCDVTGQLLPRRHWTFEADGETLLARDPHCEELYLARRGEDGVSDDD